MIEFTVYVKPEPQGSAKGFPIRRANGKMGVLITSSNKALKPFRHAVAQMAVIRVKNMGLFMPVVPKHTPVWLEATCFFNKPQSAPTKREYPVVKPDVDKLARAIFDALKGILYTDDAEVIQLRIRKEYGAPERVCVRASYPTLEGTTEDNPVAVHFDNWKDVGTPF